LAKGIYKIINKENSKIYIGSSIDIEHRWYQHKYYLKNNKHDNKHLQRAWNKYGEDAFLFEIIEECEENKILEREQYWINKLDVCNDKIGYNIAKNTTAPMIGRKHTKETLKKVSESSKQWHKENKGTEKYDIYLQNLSNSLMGHDVSEETRKKISENHKRYSKEFGDAQRGSKNPSAKLNEKDVMKIKQMILQGIKDKEIANKFNVSRPTITYIRLGKTWTQINVMEVA
jgi:group I intron endonuclease